MTYPLSLAVSAGDPTLSAHYNNLRSDSVLLGQPSADVVNLAALLERYESRLSLQRLNTTQLRVPAAATAPVSIMIAGFMVQATANVDLAIGDIPAGAAADYYIFANRAAASTTFTLSVSTSITEVANQRLIGRFYWDGTVIVKDSVRTEQSILIKSLLYFVEPQTCNGRLTLSTGVPVPTTDIANSASVFFTPYTGNRIALYAQSCGWRLYAFSELTLNIAALGNAKNFDIWIYDDAGTLKLAYTEWTNATLRATALVQQDGVLVKSGAPGYRYLGTIRTSAAGKCDDTVLKRFVWNNYNKTSRKLKVIDATDSWTYATAAWRQWNNSAANQVAFVIGINELPVKLTFLAFAYNGAAALSARIGIGLDRSNAVDADLFSAFPVVPLNSSTPVSIFYTGFPGIGYHFLSLMEYSTAGTTTFFGDNGAPTLNQYGAIGEIIC